MVIEPILATILVQGAAFAAPCSPVPFPELSAPRAVISDRRVWICSRVVICSRSRQT